MILGRGSFTESFPLFGFELVDYERLFEEKLDLFVQLLKEQPVTWSGSTRPPLDGPVGVPAHRIRSSHRPGSVSAEARSRSFAPPVTSSR